MDIKIPIKMKTKKYINGKKVPSRDSKEFFFLQVIRKDDMPTTNDIELLSVSDNEKEPVASATDDDTSTVIPDVIARYYYTSQDSKSLPDRSPSIDAFVSECLYDEEEQIDENNHVDDEDIGDERNNSEMECATNFLETQFFVGDDEVNPESIDRVFKSAMIDDEISSATTLSTSAIAPYVYGVPRLKKISLEDQLIKQRRTCVSNRVMKEPRKIVCNMYGVKTINYDLPTQDQVQAQVGVKSSTLSESDSDVSEPPPSRDGEKTTPLFESEWRDIEKNLHQPLLSDPSSSPSSRSDTNSSSTCWSTSSSTCSVCSTCTEKNMS